jgi:hypothetical protein
MTAKCSWGSSRRSDRNSYIIFDLTSMSPMKTAALLLACAAPLLAQMPASAAPEGWRLYPDRGRDSASQAAVAFAAMAPGWHITAPAGATLRHEDATLWGRFELQSRLIVFPNSGADEYGLFLGGSDLGTPAARWTGFVLRRDGSAAVLRHEEGRTSPVVAWHRAAAVRPAGAAPVPNLVRIVVDTAVHFLVNDSTLAVLPLGHVPVDGAYGFRVGAGTNLHVTTLDATLRLAPVPPAARP